MKIRENQTNSGSHTVPSSYFNFSLYNINTVAYNSPRQCVFNFYLKFFFLFNFLNFCSGIECTVFRSVVCYNTVIPYIRFIHLPSVNDIEYDF